MQVGRAFLYRIQQHLVNKADYRSILGIFGVIASFFIIDNGLYFQSIQVSIRHIVKSGIGCAVEVLLDSCTEFVILYDHRIRPPTGIELNIAQSLLIGRVSQSEKEPVSSFVER